MRSSVRYLRALVLSIVLGLSSVALLTVRFFFRTPQPVANALPGETHTYTWTHGQIFYNVFGPLHARPLVLFHAPALAGSSHEMQALMEELAQQYRVYALDLPGFGLSDRPALQYTGATYVTIFKDFLTNVVKQPAVLVAGGLSCNYCVELAASTPELCERLVLLSPLALFQPYRFPFWLSTLLTRRPLDILVYACLTPRPLLQQLISRQRHSTRWQGNNKELDYLYATAHQFGAEHAVMALLTGTLGLDVLPKGPRVPQPTLVLWNSESSATFVFVIVRHSISTQQQSAVIESASLLIYDEAPRQVAEQILHWDASTSEHPSVEKQIPTTTEEPAPQQHSELPQQKEESTFVPENTGTDVSEASQAGSEVETQNRSVAEEEAAQEEQVEAYCVKCRTKRMMVLPQHIVTKNGRNAVEGICPVCGTRLFRFVANR